MTGELEKALERLRLKNEEALRLRQLQLEEEQATALEKTVKVNSEFETLIAPLLNRFWSENVPQEFVQLFNEYERQVAKKTKRDPLLFKINWSVGYSSGVFGVLFYPDPIGRNPETVMLAKERVLRVFRDRGWEGLEVVGTYELYRREPSPYGFSITNQNPSSIHWWTGAGDAESMEGDYLKTQESLEKTAAALAEALEKGIYTYWYESSSEPPGIS